MKAAFTRLRKWAVGAPGSLALELVAIAAVLGLVARLWPRTPIPAGADLPPAPWWGGLRDLLLEGPDAAQWAENAQRMADGEFDRLDPHRMPSWLLLVAGFVRQGWTVVEAGHVVNRSMFVVAGLGTYALGRAVGGRATGVIAAAILLAHPHLQLGTQRFGIDASIEAMLPLAAALGFVAARKWWLGLFVGLLVGWIQFLHHTTLPYIVPVLLLALLCGERGWRRWAGAAALTLGAALVLVALLRFHPLPNLEQVRMVVQEGARPGSTATGAGASQDLVASVRAQIVTSLPAARSTLALQLWNPQIPAAALFWLLGLGVFAPFLVPGAPRRAPAPSAGPAPRPKLSKKARFAALLGAFARELARNSAVGLVLLACLAPLPILTALHAPPRYGSNLTAFAAVLVARGIVTILAAPERLLRLLVALWPAGFVAGAAAGVFAYQASLAPLSGRPPPPLDDDVIGIYQLGRTLQATFPPGAGVECSVTEALMQAGLVPCGAPRCPVSSDEPTIEACLRALAVACPVDGTVGYVLLPGHEMYDPNSPGRAAMDAWVSARFQPAAVVKSGGFSASIYRIPVGAIPR